MQSDGIPLTKYAKSNAPPPQQGHISPVNHLCFAPCLDPGKSLHPVCLCVGPAGNLERTFRIGDKPRRLHLLAQVVAYALLKIGELHICSLHFGKV